MKIKEFHRKYQITDYSLKLGKGEATLKWNYAAGTYFFVFLYDARKNLDLNEVVQELQEMGYEDKTLLQKQGNRLYTTQDGRVKVFLYREKEFIQNHLSCSILNGERKHGVPYGIRVLVGEYDKEGEEFSLYLGQDMENTRFIPVKVIPEIRYLPKHFSKEKYCLLQIPWIQDYMDGALEYLVDGVQAAYPIPCGCLGKEMVILIPRRAFVRVGVGERYRMYYRV